MNRINNYYLYYYSIGNNFIQQARNIILTYVITIGLWRKLSQLLLC